MEMVTEERWRGGPVRSVVEVPAYRRRHLRVTEKIYVERDDRLSKSVGPNFLRSFSPLRRCQCLCCYCCLFPRFKRGRWRGSFDIEVEVAP